MIADAVRRSIEDHAAALWDENPFLLATRAGRLKPEQLRTYLTNLGFMFRASLAHIRRAQGRAVELGQRRVAEFMLEKAGEEDGHEKWARDDLRTTGLARELDEGLITDAARALIARNTQLVENDPRLYLAYMTFAEYFTVLLAPDFLDAIENRCGIPRSSLSAVANHGELDRAHVAGDLALVDEIAAGDRWGEREGAEFLRAVDESAERVGRFLAACL